MNSNSSKDLDRLKAEYEDRARRLAHSDLYSRFNQPNLFRIQQLERTALKVLRDNGFYPLTSYRILEIGCGNGGVLLDFLGYGTRQDCLNGIDILLPRLHFAKNQLPNAHFLCADGQNIPYSHQTFDLILQYTVFSSILDPVIKSAIAADMLRVLKLKGLILWYDFWINPKNPQTRGIRPSEIQRLFPHCNYKFYRITLAPPIARRLVPVSWTLAYLLEKLTLLNSHYLVAIQRLN